MIASTTHIHTLLAFLATWKRSDALLIHCRAGIGRSTAASPAARPNEVLVSLADGEMGREGRMSQAIMSTGVGLPEVEVEENEPFELVLS